MRILAFDLAWIGKTGWCVFDTETRQFVAHGEFKPKLRGKDAYRLRSICLQIFSNVAELLHHEPDVVVYEYTDWHQGNGRGAQTRERNVQRALGRAEAAFLLSLPDTIDIVRIGANEAKREFGATRKDAVTKLLVAEFDQLRMDDNLGVYDYNTMEFLSHDITDAMALAVVVDRRKKLEAVVKIISTKERTQQ